MKKALPILFILFLSGIRFAEAQDIILDLSGNEISAKILEVNTTEIRYKKSDNPDGPSFLMPKSEVMMIKYANGTKDVFNNGNSKTSIYQPMNSGNGGSGMDISGKARMDAHMYYTGQHSGAGWVLGASIMSPFYGVIPAVVCSSSPPVDYNLNVPNYESLSNPAYMAAYRQEAHAIKRKKIWKNFGIGSAIWLGMVAIIVTSLSSAP